MVASVGANTLDIQFVYRQVLSFGLVGTYVFAVGAELNLRIYGFFMW